MQTKLLGWGRQKGAKHGYPKLAKQSKTPSGVKSSVESKGMSQHKFLKKNDVRTIHNEPVVGTIKDYDYKGRKQDVTLKVELKKDDGTKKGVDGIEYSDPLTLSISGAIWNSNHSDCITAGQIYEELENAINSHKFEPMNGITTDEFKKLLQTWKRWHLNDLKAATLEQQKVLDEHMKEAKYEKFDKFLDRPRAILKDHNLDPDKSGYRYGDAWLYEPLPDSVIDFVKEIQEKLGK